MITFAPGKRSRAFGFWFYYPFVAVCLMRNQILLAAVRRVALVTGIRIGNCKQEISVIDAANWRTTQQAV